MERAIQLDNIFSTTDSVRLSISCGCLVLTALSISRKSSARRTLVAYSMLPINVTTNSEATLTLIKHKGSVSDELDATHSRQDNNQSRKTTYLSRMLKDFCDSSVSMNVNRKCLLQISCSNCIMAAS